MQEAHNRRKRFTFLQHVVSFELLVCINTYLLTWCISTPDTAQGIAVISMTSMLVLMIWAEWLKKRPNMWLMLLKMEMCRGSSIIGKHLSPSHTIYQLCCCCCRTFLPFQSSMKPCYFLLFYFLFFYITCYNIRCLKCDWH